MLPLIFSGGKEVRRGPGKEVGGGMLPRIQGGARTGWWLQGKEGSAAPRFLNLYNHVILSSDFKTLILKKKKNEKKPIILPVLDYFLCRLCSHLLGP